MSPNWEPMIEYIYKHIKSLHSSNIKVNISNHVYLLNVTLTNNNNKHYQFLITSSDTLDNVDTCIQIGVSYVNSQ